MKLFAEIIPALNTNLGTLFYEIPEGFNVRRGQIVDVPFRTKTISGIVKRITTAQPAFRTKSIDKKNTITFDEKTVDLIEWISAYFNASLTSVFKLFFPTYLGKKIPKISTTENPTLEAKNKKILNQTQQKIFNEIMNSDKKMHLIHGVTGSGKTEIFLHLIEQNLKQGKQSLVLLPEIAITPQTKQYFENAFDKGVVVLHSKMSPKEKKYAWHQIYNDEAKIIIGARSALFTPMKHLSLIIVDECHEESYKQETSPAYSVNTVVSHMTKLNDLKIVYASATPPIEMYYHALKNSDTTLHTISTKISETKRNIEIVDMREEVKSGNFSIFSDVLISALQAVFEKNEQAILFVNRRGTATAVVCRDCGYREKCETCELPFTYHEYKRSMWNECHHCGMIKDVKINCPQCHGYKFRQLGLGTERVEKEIQKLFPEKIILRADTDMIKTGKTIEDIYHTFKSGKADLLIGTQMIAKGWDIENVTLVGIVMADMGLNIPDFRAQERVFQLLTQVAGRTARGNKIGKVIVQTYMPDNSTIKFATKEDFNGFYTYEIEQRNRHHFPPFKKILKLEVKDETNIEKATKDIVKELEEKFPHDKVTYTIERTKNAAKTPIGNIYIRTLIPQECINHAKTLKNVKIERV